MAIHQIILVIHVHLLLLPIRQLIALWTGSFSLLSEHGSILIKIRGPDRVLALLRQRIVDLPIEVEYVEDERVETVVEANATRIVAELRPWAELLASSEA